MIAADSLDQVFAEAQVQAAQPLWTVMDSMVPPAPNPRATPHLWSYAQMRPLLLRAGELVGTEEAERRVFMLVNPTMRAPFTTDTLYAGLQYIRPGEVARAHRHMAFALRFIVEGDGAYTAVGGEKVTMERGDVILTPTWDFHDHGHEGTQGMIWLDGLDLPLFQWLPTNFAQPYHEDRYPSEPSTTDSHLKYPWAEMQAKLDAHAGPFAEERYAHRRTGGHISKTLGAVVERLAAGTTAPKRRETSSSVYHVHSGTGFTTVGETTLHWESGDTIAIPAWMPFEHHATGATYLFRFDDKPMLDALGYYKREEN